MKSINIVLVRSKYPRNVGMISRIMGNFDVQRLILIDPQCEMNEQARQGAAQGQQALSNITIYKTWDEFYATEPEAPRIAFSRRQGKRRPSIPLHELLELDIIKDPRPPYLIFGAEDHGLSAEDLEMVHRVTHFDIPGPIQSMNLSHAVLMVLHSFYEHSRHEHKENDLKKEPITSPEKSLRQWLKALDFDLDSQTRWNALTMLKQIIMKGAPSNDELHKLDMIIQHTVRKLKDKSSK